jgi:small subunit ribosomal protein S22
MRGKTGETPLQDVRSQSPSASSITASISCVHSGMSRITCSVLSSRTLVHRRPFHLSAHWHAVKKPEDAEKLFLHENVQSCLRRLVGFEPNVVFKRRPIPKLTSPRYVMMTDKELEISLDRVNRRGRKILELVPYKAPHSEEDADVLSKDPELQGYMDAPIVFTDISPGSNDRNRLIAVRETNGLLRRATREERLRMNQIYYPNESRFHAMPPMFEDVHLQPVLDRRDYIFILDRACVQFEPDEPDFHRVCNRTFDHINEHKEYDVLRSNRYFGSFVFYHVINDNMDGLLQHFIEKENMSDAQLLIQLYYQIHTEKQAEFKTVPDDPVKQIRVSRFMISI